MQNLNNLDLNLLKALHALIEERNVSRAAERLNLTQPAVSTMLAKLRHRFNDPLFIRTAHGMIPTARAEALAQPVKAILDSIGILMQPVAFNPINLEYTFKLAGTENGIRTLGVPFALKLAHLAPKVKVVFLAVQGQDLNKNLADGVWDLAMTGQQQLDDRVHFDFLMGEEYGCAVRQDHPVLAQKWDLDAFCALEFVLVAYHGGHFTGATDEALARLGRSRTVKMSIGHFSLLPDLLKNSDLATVAPIHFLKTQNELILLKPPLVIEGYTKVMAWHAKTNYDPVQIWFRQVMKEVAKDIQPT
ncbi:transcriptional regulator [Ursidibacter arcticus]|uniref:LysR family transcriptional regulator n=1 Tax=Ursidibacter arcticus TaxID=1524965 RepID=UPI0012FB87F2|nr:LysR family transcriptional regulator [Ursidibacter arcticus]KAE9534219.1 transcriptional regulator [Ursidibacter arcticus]